MADDKPIKFGVTSQIIIILSVLTTLLGIISGWLTSQNSKKQLKDSSSQEIVSPKFSYKIYFKHILDLDLARLINRRNAGEKDILVFRYQISYRNILV